MAKAEDIALHACHYCCQSSNQFEGESHDPEHCICTAHIESRPDVYGKGDSKSLQTNGKVSSEQGSYGKAAMTLQPLETTYISNEHLNKVPRVSNNINIDTCRAPDESTGHSLSPILEAHIIPTLPGEEVERVCDRDNILAGNDEELDEPERENDLEPLIERRQCHKKHRIICLGIVLLAVLLTITVGISIGSQGNPSTATPASTTPASNTTQSTSPTSSASTSVKITTSSGTTPNTTTTRPTTVTANFTIPTTSSKTSSTTSLATFTTTDSSSTTRTITIPTTTTARPLPTECLEASNYTEAWRLDHGGTNHQPGGDHSYNGYACDFYVGSSWFRFSGAGGSMMMNRCVPVNSCGTYLPFWTDDQMPQAVGAAKSIKAYGSYTKCRAKIVNIKVMRCSWNGNDFIYKYDDNPYDKCFYAFCGMT